MGRAKARQRGAALFICLALLLVLGIAGASAVRTAILEERMARNTVDALLALQAAEAALGEGEALLPESLDSTAHFTDAGTNGLWTAAPLGEEERWTVAEVWEPASGKSRAVPNRIDLVATQPRFIIEWIATLGIAPNPHLIEESSGTAQEPIEVFRITARGVGRTANARTLVQSTFGVALTNTTGTSPRGSLLELDDDGFVDDEDLTAHQGENHFLGMILDNDNFSGTLQDTGLVANGDGSTALVIGNGDGGLSPNVTALWPPKTGRLSWRELSGPVP